MGSDLWCQPRHECLFPWLRVQVGSLGNGSARPPLPPKGKTVTGPDWAEEGLVGVGQNGTHIGQVLEAPAQGLP